MAFIRSITVVSFETSDTIKYLELNRVGFILYECPFPKNYILIIFRGCFTVQLSRFLTLFEVRQRILCYQRYFVLSTLFLIFFHFSHIYFWLLQKGISNTQNSPENRGNNNHRIICHRNHKIRNYCCKTSIF